MNDVIWLESDESFIADVQTQRVFPRGMKADRWLDALRLSNALVNRYQDVSR